MKNFEGKLAVITGAATGMGRELALQLTASGCHVAICDIAAEKMEQTKKDCLAAAPAGTRVTTHTCDMGVEEDIVAFRDAVAKEHDTDQVNLVFNNAGISGAGSFVNDPRETWDKVFAICWGGVYHSTRAFMPMLIASDGGHLINTSSVNGLWASLGPDTPHTAYSAAKFAVRGFTEALVNDLRINAPHVKVSLVMPGHIGTSIFVNSMKLMTGIDPDKMTPESSKAMRERAKKMGVPVDGLTDEMLLQGMLGMMEKMEKGAPVSAAEAATVMLDGVRDERWRILVGDDAREIDELVRQHPEEAYERSFMKRFEKFLSAAGD